MFTTQASDTQRFTSGRTGLFGRSSRVACLLCATVLTASGAFAQGGGSQPSKDSDNTNPDKAVQNTESVPATLPVQRLIAFKRGALSEFIVDEKDAKLVAAFGMIQERLAELSQESEGEIPEEPMEALQTFLGAIASPSRLAVTFNPQSNAGGLMGYGVVASSVFADETDAAIVREFVEDIFAEQGAALPKLSKIHKGMRTMTVPGGKLSFGPRTGGKTYDVFFGTVPDEPDAAFDAIPAPTIDGLKPVITGTFDAEALTPLFNLASMGLSQAAGGQAADMLSQFPALGYVGPDAIKGTFELGYTKDASRARVVVNNAARVMTALDVKAHKLTADELNIVPADARTAAVSLISSTSWEAMFKQVNMETGMGQENPVAQGLAKIKEVTGVDLETDLAAALGGYGGVYTADVTGGGFLGFVAFLSFKDRGAFITMHDKLVKAAGEQIRAADARAARYIKLRPWSDSGVEYFTLTFTGLPVPVEFTYAVTEKLLLAGLTPQATMAAVRQATGKGDAGLLSRKDMHLLDVSKQDVISVTFSDTLVQARKGYNLTSMLGSAVANMVRSPLGGKREPGLIVPPVGELLANVRPSVQVTHRSGDSLMLEWSSDRSVLVTAASAMGTFQDLSPILGVLGAAIFAETQKGQQSNFQPDFTFLPIDVSPQQMFTMVREIRTRPEFRLIAGARALFGGPLSFGESELLSAGVAAATSRQVR
jgi:hypothetical protein